MKTKSVLLALVVFGALFCVRSVVCGSVQEIVAQNGVSEGDDNAVILDCATSAGYQVSQWRSMATSDSQTSYLVMLGVYETRSDHRFGYHPMGNARVNVDLSSWMANTEIVLVVSSYEPTNWTIHARATTDSAAILQNVIAIGYHEQVVTLVDETPTTTTTTTVETYSYEAGNRGLREFCGFSYPSNGQGCNTNALIAMVEEMTGLSLNAFDGCYRATQFQVSRHSSNAFEQDEERCRQRTQEKKRKRQATRTFSVHSEKQETTRQRHKCGALRNANKAKKLCFHNQDDSATTATTWSNAARKCSCFCDASPPQPPADEAIELAPVILDCSSNRSYRWDKPQTDDDNHDGTLLFMLGVYETAEERGFRQHPVGTATVDFTFTSNRNVVLVLSSYEPTHWTIRRHVNAAPISRVLAIGYHAQSVSVTVFSRNDGVSVEEEDDVEIETLDYVEGGDPLDEYCGYSYPYNGGGCDTDQLIAMVEEMTGQSVTTFSGCYQATRFQFTNKGSTTVTTQTTITSRDNNDRNTDRVCTPRQEELQRKKTFSTTSRSMVTQEKTRKCGILRNRKLAQKYCSSANPKMSDAATRCTAYCHTHSNCNE